MPDREDNPRRSLKNTRRFCIRHFYDVNDLNSRQSELVFAQALF